MSAAEAVRQAKAGTPAREREAGHRIGRDPIVEAGGIAEGAHRPVVASNPQRVTGGVGLAAIARGPDAPAARIGATAASAWYSLVDTSKATGRPSGANARLSANGLVTSDRNEFIAWVPACAAPVPASPESCANASASWLGDRNEEVRECRRQRAAVSDKGINGICDRALIARGRGWQHRRSRGRCGAADCDGVVIQRDRTVLCQSITAVYFSAGIQRDARQREDVPCERCARAERRGTADPEKHIAALSAVDQRNARTAGSGQRAPDVEDED